MPVIHQQMSPTLIASQPQSLLNIGRNMQHPVLTLASPYSIENRESQQRHVRIYYITYVLKEKIQNLKRNNFL